MSHNATVPPAAPAGVDWTVLQIVAKWLIHPSYLELVRTRIKDLFCYGLNFCIARRYCRTVQLLLYSAVRLSPSLGEEISENATCTRCTLPPG